MRTLFYIPVVHTPEDLGSYQEELKRGYVAKYGILKWNDHLKAVETLWQNIRRSIFSLSLNYEKVRLYQDGLPVCNKELEIVEKLANDGNKNYQILHEMVKKGAKIMGSEDIKLLIEERERLINAKNSIANESNEYDELMERRDSYIVQRIDSTLKDGETGLLFIGALHRIIERLPKDIQIQRLD